MTSTGVGSNRVRAMVACLAALIVASVVAASAAGVASAAGSGPPVNTVAPSITGTPKDEQRLKAVKGAWMGQATIHYSYAWSRCDQSGEACEAIASATRAGYRATHADVGHTLRVKVTATNELGKASEVSEPTAVVAPSAPAKKALPKITGVKEDGQLLTASNGVWKGTPPFSYAYKWEECDTLGLNCAVIPGAHGSTYRPTTPEIGKRLRAIVTAKNVVSSASSTSLPTGRLKAGPPVDVGVPSIEGTLQEGQTLTANVGDWAGTGPFTFSYQWQRCSILGGSCEVISGAVGASYVATGEDIAHNLSVIVTASNSLGMASASSPEGQTILAILPTNTILPSISGLFQDGGLLNVSPGTWTGSEPITYTYQWQLCNALGEACEELTGQTGTTLKLDPSEIGKTLDVIVTAKNAAGTETATSSLTSLIAGILPKNNTLPSISGSLVDGQLLSANNGEWSGSEPITYTDQWQLCNAVGASCSNLSEGSTLKLVSSEIGSTLKLVVTAKNAAGTETATSSLTSLIAGILPKNNTLPSISGSLVDGQLLSANNGEWSGSEPITYTDQWQLCNAVGVSCSNLSEGSTLKLISSYVGSTLRLVVTAKNAAGSTSETSSATTAILALLAKNVTLPSISGLLKNGATLTALTGEWSGTTPMTFGYQWQLCVLKVCTNILNATNPTLVLGIADVGNTLRVIVTAKNAAGLSAPATSGESGSILGL